MISVDKLSLKIRLIIFIVLVFIGIFGFGYYHHINEQKSKVTAYLNAKTKIPPMEACYVFLALSDNVANYNYYRSEMYGCSNAQRTQNKFGTVNFSHSAWGLKDFVVDNEVTLHVKDNMHTVAPSEEELKVNRANLNKFIELNELISELYKQPLSLEIVEKIKKFHDENSQSGRVFVDTIKYRASIEKMKIGGGATIIKVSFLGK